MSILNTNADMPEKEDAFSRDNIAEIHIGVFFDGTSNNMVRTAMKHKEKSGVVEKNPDLTRLSGDKKKEAALNVDIKEEDLFQSSVGMKDESADKYSNVSILYSLFDPRLIEQSDQSKLIKAHKFYVEGSGATDIANPISMNPNGLGFGLGKTGVTALVSKAVRAVTEYINSLSSQIDQNTKLRFYVFGFSRGATCSRLFSHLVTRSKTDKLPGREKEFNDHLSNYFSNDKLHFLEKGSNPYDIQIERANIRIEYLGIYDTVVSIGFLKQKNGWNDPLRDKFYANHENYIDNWHYLNVYEYGMYLSKDTSMLANVMHIGALDEFRENFAFTDIGKRLSGNVTEILLPGCHSDVGGGYIDGPEDEIVLPINTEKYLASSSNSMATRTKVPVTSNISKQGEVKPLGLESFKEIGWITDPGEKIDDKIYTLSAKIKDNNLYFKRYVRRGWSDVTLAMMYENCIKKFKVFQPIIMYDYRNTIKDGAVKDMGAKAISIAKNAPFGKRISLVPGGATNSERYKLLRLKYIHFTAVDQLFHISENDSRRKLTPDNVIDDLKEMAKDGVDRLLGKNEEKEKKKKDSWKEGAIGNIGNPPNFDINGILCRINYHGDSSKPASPWEGVQYLYDLEIDQQEEI